MRTSVPSPVEWTDLGNCSCTCQKTGLVSGVVQPGGDGAVLQSLIAELCPSPQGELVAVDVGVVSVLPALDGSPCRAAQRVCGGHVDELNALADDVFVQGRHRVFGSRELIVGKDEDYVGPLDRGGYRSRPVDRHDEH